MPLDEDTGKLIPFTDEEIADMGIETIGVRQMEHPIETRELGTNTMRRPFHVKWDSRFDFCELVLGRSVLYTDGGIDKLSRLVPDEDFGRHPQYPEIIATKIEKISGFGKASDDSNGMPTYETARVEVFYEHVPFDVAADDAVVDESERWLIPPGVEPSSSEAEVTTMPGSAFRYIREDESGNDTGLPPHMVPVPYNISYVTPTQERKFTWVRLPQDAWGQGTPLYQRVFEGEDDGNSFHTQVYPLIGTVNSEELLGYPIGTMLFRRVEEKLRRDPLGAGWCWDLTFVFIYRPTGWNWLRYFDVSDIPVANYNDVYFVGSTSTFYTADTLPDNHSLYNGRDHNTLFQVGALS